MVRLLMENSTSDQTKTCAEFEVLNYRKNAMHDADIAVHPSRVSIAKYILNAIVGGLRDAGHEISEVKRGKGCDAACSCKMKCFSIVMVLNVARRSPNVATCHLLTWLSPALRESFLGARLTAQDSKAEALDRICRALDLEMNKRLNIQSLQWLTREQAENRWSRRLQSS